MTQQTQHDHLAGDYLTGHHLNGLIFSEGNGYGHAARDRILAEAFGLPIMTFGKGAEYCKKSNIRHIEIPTPYVIQSGSGSSHKPRIATNFSELPSFLKPDVLLTLRKHFGKADFVIIDGSSLALAVAELIGKKTIFITNDTSAVVGIRGNLERKVALSLFSQLLKKTTVVAVPDFVPPFTVSALNLDPAHKLHFIGPLVRKVKQKPHRCKYLVVGKLEKKLRSFLGNDAIYGSQVGDLLPYYANAEAIICHGGHTTIMEALAYGKPVISIVDSSYSERMNNARMLEKLGVGVTLDERLVSKESISAAIILASTLDKNRLASYRLLAEANDPVAEVRKLVDGM